MTMKLDSDISQPREQTDMSEDDENRDANGDESEDGLEKGEYSNYKTVWDEEELARHKPFDGHRRVSNGLRSPILALPWSFCHFD